MRPSDAQSGRTAASTDAGTYTNGSETENPPPLALAPRSMLQRSYGFTP